MKTACFAFGPVGYSGETSDGEMAFARVVRKKEAIRFILAAFEHGGAHSRCYALVALRETSVGLFHAALAAMRNGPPKKITIVSGCIISEVEAEEVFAAIEAGAYSHEFKRHEEKG